MNPLQALRSPEHSLLCSPIGLRVIDSFTKEPPLAPLRVRVDVQAGTEWIETALRVTRTPSGMFTLPGLGRRRDPVTNASQQRYRLRIEAAEYIAAYRNLADGFEFVVHPYDELNPLEILNTTIETIELHPSVAYPYATPVRVIHGRVLEKTNGAPVRDAVIQFQGLDRAMTDLRGEFAFGLRRAPASGEIVLDVYHDRSGRTQDFTLALPYALEKNQELKLRRASWPNI